MARKGKNSRLSDSERKRQLSSTAQHHYAKYGTEPTPLSEARGERGRRAAHIGATDLFDEPKVSTSAKSQNANG